MHDPRDSTVLHGWVFLFLLNVGNVEIRDKNRHLHVKHCEFGGKETNNQGILEKGSIKGSPYSTLSIQYIIIMRQWTIHYVVYSTLISIALLYR